MTHLFQIPISNSISPWQAGTKWATLGEASRIRLALVWFAQSHTISTLSLCSKWYFHNSWNAREFFLLFDRFLCRPPKARCPVAWRCVTKWPILSVTPWIINTPPSHSWFTIWKRESESGSFQESIIDYLKITHSRRRTGMLVIFTHVLDRLPDRALKTIFIVPVSNLIGLIHLGAPNRDYRASQ